MSEIAALLEAKRELLAERREQDEAVRHLAYAANVLEDVEARRELGELRERALSSDRELQAVENALREAHARENAA
jgi:hypothetical protein